MQPAEKINKILVGMTQSALARKLGIEQSSVSTFASGRKQPGPATCLALAGVCPPDDRHYWIELSGLSIEALDSTCIALGSPMQPERMSGDERDLLDWWRSPRNKMEKSIKDLVEQLLEVRADWP